MTIEVSPVARRKALTPKDMTPLGITTAPAQAPPLETTPVVISNVGVTTEARPVKQLYVPSGG